MDFFRGSSSPLRGGSSPVRGGSSPVRSRASSVNSHRQEYTEEEDPAESNNSSNRNLFSYYFMLRTGKFLDPSITDQTRKFIFRVRNSKDDISVKSKEVQMFYTYMTDKLHDFPYFLSWKPDAINDLVVGMERFVMVNIFESVFNPPSDQIKNSTLDEKIRSLHWILPKHLDFALPSENEATDRQLALAQYYLLELNKKRSPHDKVTCMVLCCKALHDLFNVAHDKAAGADELLPMLIYTLIVAAPPNLHATTQYIERFLPQERLTSGATAYNFTNMCCALQFLENIAPDKLSLSTDEYHHFMQGHSSHLEEALSNKFAGGLLDNISRVKECEEKFRNLQGYHDKLKGNTEQLSLDVGKHKAEVLQSLAQMRSKFSALDEEMAKLLVS